MLFDIEVLGNVIKEKKTEIKGLEKKKSQSQGVDKKSSRVSDKANSCIKRSQQNQMANMSTFK